MFIHEVCQVLNKAKIPYAIVGGFAVALHGIVRGTIDVDIALKWSLKNLEKTENALNSLGLVSLLPINAHNLFHFKNEYIQNRNLIAWNFYDPKNPNKQVDIIITFDLKDAHTTLFKSQQGTIRVLSKKDLIAMKKASGRPQDLEDVKALESL